MPLTDDNNTQKIYGKYRAKVINNIDPFELGRVQIEAASALGTNIVSWAMPCVPYAGPGVGLYAIPPIDANVWIEFEGGNPDYPIWSGCFWNEGEMPLEPVDPLVKKFKTETGYLEISDVPEEGGITLETYDPAVLIPLTLNMQENFIKLTAEPATVTISEEEIVISFPPGSVTLNEAMVKINEAECSITLTDTGITSTTGAATAALETGVVSVDGESINMTGAGEVAIEAAEVSVNGVTTINEVSLTVE
jgi:Type VI secretion system/phage-baseplate injector OB domain